MTKAQQIAAILLEIKAIKLNLKNPFHYTSGILSPIYCDNRMVISYPDKRQVIIEAFLATIKENQLQFDVVAGTATAGIPHAAWIADRLNLPMIYVRASAKDHGLHNQIEGKIEPGQTALIIEDLISTGKSAVNVAAALREQDAEVKDCIAIFNYQLEEAANAFFEADINLIPLCNFATLLDVATKNEYISPQEFEVASRWNENPNEWRL